jgi:hypothetical protein
MPTNCRETFAGNPKGVTLSHHNLINNGYFIGYRIGYNIKVPVLLNIYRIQYEGTVGID